MITDIRKSKEQFSQSDLIFIYHCDELQTNQRGGGVHENWTPKEDCENNFEVAMPYYDGAYCSFSLCLWKECFQCMDPPAGN